MLDVQRKSGGYAVTHMSVLHTNLPICNSLQEQHAFIHILKKRPGLVGWRDLEKKGNIAFGGRPEVS